MVYGNVVARGIDPAGCRIEIRVRGQRSRWGKGEYLLLPMRRVANPALWIPYSGE